MISCAGCSRFVRPETRRCPFCHVALRESSSPAKPTMVGVLLGLTLAACGGDSTLALG